MAVLRAEGMPAACLHLPWGGAASPCPPGATPGRHGLAPRSDRNEPRDCMLMHNEGMLHPSQGGLGNCILILQSCLCLTGNASGKVSRSSLQY